MLDFSLSVDVAKAFASHVSGAREDEDDLQPTLLQAVVLGLGYFDVTQLLDAMQFERPRQQHAVAEFGISRDTNSGMLTDPHGLLIAVTEHSLGDGGGWERFGGPSFTVNGVHFQSPSLSVADQARLHDLLFCLTSRSQPATRCYAPSKRLSGASHSSTSLENIP
jgi:hypothetical protein